MGAMVVLLTVVLACVEAVAQPPGGMAAAPVRVSEVVQRPIPTGRTFVGTVVPKRSSTVGSAVEARVVEMLVLRGEYVKKDQALVRLRTRDLEIELEAAKAELRLREAERDELKLTAPKEIEQAEARMLAAKSLQEYASARAKRAEELYRRKAASEDEVQERRSASEVANKKYQEAKSAWELATAGKWDQQVAQAEARVDVQDETVNKLEDDIDEHTIYAPFDGFVTEKLTEVGQWVPKGGAVMEVVEVDPIDIMVPVLESYVTNLRTGAAARVEIQAIAGLIPPGEERMLPGEVAQVVPQADLRSRSFPVKVRLDNPVVDGQARIKPGMFARVTLPVGGREDALLVPKDALVFSEDTVRVWVVTPDEKNKGQGMVRPVSVELGIADGGMMEVRGDLQAGQLVVTEGNERINPVQPVRYGD